MVGSSHLIEALTVPTAAYSFNYERLEVIGDTFLKFLATAYVFAENIESQERLLHYARREIIMIRTLLKHCMDHKLDDFMSELEGFFAYKFHSPRIALQVITHHSNLDQSSASLV
ncbi:hypothetical protein CF335_g3399 [Tilletia laevis]|nr:hypothetical protein CF335_g3399 [Tilletia laevis]